MEAPLVVKALYDFVKSNTDELTFKKGDIITITQKPEGGWWEGTLNDETGWFPVTYVAECKQATENGHTPDNRQEYRKAVLSNLVASERKHVEDLMSFQRTYLNPLKAAHIIPESDYMTLCGNFEDIIHLHSNLVIQFNDILRTPPEQQAFGKLFMQEALNLKAAHLNYCSNHPRAIQVLNHYREPVAAFCKNLSQQSVIVREGVTADDAVMLTLTTELSRPFRRLDKYPNMLQELERHLEEFNSDRGNTQRAVIVFTEIASLCAEARRQKEIELEILKGHIKDYQGPDIGSLGDVILMTQVSVRDEPSAPKQERYLVLFEDCLLMLAASPRMSSFMYMSHSSLSGLKLRPLESSDFCSSFEIWSKSLDRKIVECKTLEEMRCWLETLSAQIQKSTTRSAVGRSNTLPKPSKLASVNGLQISPPKDILRENLPILSPRGQRFKPPIIINSVWSGSSLRPHPPLRPTSFSKEEKPAAVSQSPKLPRKFSAKRKDPVKVTKSEEPLIPVEKAQQYEDDAVLLGVIDSYCISSKTRHKVNSELLDSPHVLVAEEEKILVEGFQGNFVEEKTLVDTVYGLKDELQLLSAEIVKLHKMLEEEKKARRRMEMSYHDVRITNGERSSESVNF